MGSTVVDGVASTQIRLFWSKYPSVVVIIPVVLVAVPTASSPELPGEGEGDTELDGEVEAEGDVDDDGEIEGLTELDGERELDGLTLAEGEELVELDGLAEADGELL